MGLFRRILRPRNVAIGLAVAAPTTYFIAFAKDAEGNPAQARYWQVKAYSLVPLRAASRLWGSFNSITLPVWFRPTGFRAYAWLFGVDLGEMADADLTHYANLGEFFYRKIRPEARPLANALMVSPCDGKVLQFGEIHDNSHIEQVKGVRYPLQRFLGGPASSSSESSSSESSNNESSNNDSASESSIPNSSNASSRGPVRGDQEDGVNVQRDEKFAEMNGLSYTIDDIVGGNTEHGLQRPTVVDKGDAADSAKGILATPVWAPTFGESTRLFYCVIYLAPGDYHRFHSPVPWIVTLRRHFVGELFSVAPYFQTRLADLFCLNERVALLGKWRHGFFSMTPVGATNVGSIVVNFDRFLKTNQRGAVANTCYEASYSSASPILQGFPLETGEEMGGFRLGSTVVLVFEAPESFQFSVARNSTVKMGEALGDVRSESA